MRNTACLEDILWFCLFGGSGRVEREEAWALTGFGKDLVFWDGVLPWQDRNKVSPALSGPEQMLVLVLRSV